MHLKPLVIFASISSLLVKSWTIPEGQSDGLYTVSTDEYGHENHTLIAIAPDKNMPVVNLRDIVPMISSAKFAKRQLGDYTEACGAYAMDATDTNNAFNGLRTLCSTTSALQPLWDIYALAGSVVAYMCNSDELIACSPEQLSVVFQQYISAYCGSFRSGWAIHFGSGGNFQYQIGYEGAGANFCGRGQGYSPSLCIVS